MAQLNQTQIWEQLNKQLFAVIGMVTKKGEARTVGIVYVIHDFITYGVGMSLREMRDQQKARGRVAVA